MTTEHQPREIEGRWSVWKITLLLYPLAWGAAAVNIFFLGLMIQAINVTAFSPVACIVIGAFVGVPFSYLFSRHIRKLMDQANE